MSVVARSPSATQLATPRAMSPQDVVRIYVPPAPPEEQHHQQQQQQSHPLQKGTPNSASTTTVVAAAAAMKKDSPGRNTNRYSNGSNYSGGGGTPVVVSRQSNYNDEEEEEAKTRRNSEIELYSGRFEYGSDYGTTTSSIQNYGVNGRSTSSSRRGSMSRKSPAPMLDGEFIIECSHLKGRKYVPDHHTSHTSLTQGGRGVRNGSESNIHRMTSFEELAKNKGTTSGSNSSLLKHVNDDYIIRQMVRARGNRMTKSEIYETVDSSESGSNDRYEIYASINSQKISRGHKSDYNIQYKNMSTRGAMAATDSVGGHDYNSIEYKTFKTRQSSRESGNDSSPFDYDLLPDGRHENSALRDYNRFFNNEDDDEDKLLNKSSDESSTSPPPHRQQVQYVQQKPSPMSPNVEAVPLLSSPTVRKTSIPSSSSIPVSNSMKRNKKHSSTTEQNFRLELSSPLTSSNRRNDAPASSSSRIPVIKSPTSPTSSLQGSLRQPSRSRIPTSHVAATNGSRISPTTGSSIGRRIGTSSSAHQIQQSGAGGTGADSNKIRIKVNQSQSYSSG